MKIKSTHTISYFETDSTYMAKLSFLFQHLQNAAVMHSEKAGYQMDQLIQGGQGWVLNKMEMKIIRYPRYAETIDIATWSRGMKGVKAKREFLVSANGDTLIAASSVWIFVDSVHMKIIRIPEDMESNYTIHADIALNENLEKWRAVKDVTMDFQQNVTTRSSDYDPMGHVNNTVYFDFLETAIQRKLRLPVRISHVKMQYIQELDTAINQVHVNLQEVDGKYLFAITDGRQINAAGELIIRDALPDQQNR